MVNLKSDGNQSTVTLKEEGASSDKEQPNEAGQKMTGRRRLFLMRHGHVDYFKSGITDPRIVDLTDEGREQAEEAGKALSRINFDYTLCSGLPRTRQTAEIVLSHQGRPPIIQEDLRFEEIKSGWIKASSREELAARLAYCFDNAEDKDAKFLPDGETFGSVEERTVEGLVEMLTTRSWRTGLLVAHEGVNRVLLGWCTGGGLATIGAFEQDLCAINVIDFDITPSESGKGVQIERAILKLMNVTPYDVVKQELARTSLEHLFDVDFGGSRPILSKT